MTRPISTLEITGMRCLASGQLDQKMPAVILRLANVVDDLRAELGEVDESECAIRPHQVGGLFSDTRCECCGLMMRAGERIATWWDDDAGEVTAHAGPCPEPELWWNGRPESLPKPFEEAFARAKVDIRYGLERRVRLRRVRDEEAIRG